MTRKQILRCVLLAVSLMVLGGCASSCNHTSQTALKEEFSSEFGFVPPATVEVLHCKTYSIGDSYGRYIVFTSDEANLQRIAGSGFTNATREQLDVPWGSMWRQHLEKSSGAPSWWRTPSTNKFRVYYKEPSRKDFGGSYHYFWIDDNTRTVYSESAGWD